MHRRVALTVAVLSGIGCHTPARTTEHAARAAGSASESERASSASSTASDELARERPRVEGPVLVELFTSEGCSSCPPADRVFAALAEASDSPILPLAFHVDYWDSLGWADRFATHAASERQREYARAFGRGGPYTPQAVVQGRFETIGSRRDEIEAAASRESNHATIRLSVHRSASLELTVETSTEDAPSSAHIIVALYQRSAESRPTRGENEGAVLRHANVVRSFREATLPTAKLTLPIPADARGPLGVAAWVEEPIASNGHGVLALAHTMVEPR
jgi:hypothetical protein